MKALIAQLQRGTPLQFLMAPAGLLLVAACFGLAEPQFASLANLGNIAGQACLLMLLAAGQMAVMANRGFDISVGAVAALSSTLAALAVNQFGSAGLLVGLLAGAAFGLLNGLLVACVGVQPIIATLGSLLLAKAVARLVSDDGQAVVVQNNALLDGLGNATWLALPPLFWLSLLALLALGLLLYRSSMGRRLFMCGSNPQAARLIGISVAHSTCLAYVLCGAMAGLGGVVLLVRSGAGLPTEGAGLELQSIAAALIGGTALAGGSASLLATLAGALFIQVVLTGLNLVGIAPFLAQALFGMLILGSGLLEKLTHRFFDTPQGST